MTAPGGSPERYLDTSSDPAVVVTAYDTTELATAAGEELALPERDDPSSWALVRNAEDRKGWVPLSTIEPVPEQSHRRRKSRRFYSETTGSLQNNLSPAARASWTCSADAAVSLWLRTTRVPSRFARSPYVRPDP